MSEQTTEKAQTVEQVWIRNVRGLQAKAGPWHLVLCYRDRSWFGDMSCECGVYPDQARQTVRDERPTEGRFCRTCSRAADQRPPRSGPSK